MLRALGVGILALCPLGLLAGEPPPAFPFATPTQLGSARSTTEMVSFQVGRAKLDFTGRWAPLLRDDKVVGLFLEGQGKVNYTSTFEPEWPGFTRNLNDWPALKPVPADHAQTITLPFRMARVFFSGTPVPAWNGSASGSLEDRYAPFDDRWTRVDGHVPSHLQAWQALNAPTKVVTTIEFEQVGQPWLYTHDGANQMVETLQWAIPTQDLRNGIRDWFTLVQLSSQPIGWDPRKGLAPTHFQLTGLDVDLRAKDSRNAEAIVQETITPLESGLQAFSFNLWSNLILPKDIRYLRVTRITDGDGRNLAYSHSHDRLTVLLPAPAAKGVPFTLKLEYQGDFLVQPNEDNYWQLGAKEGWYPTPDNLASEYYTFHGTVRTKGDWIAFLPGETVRREKDGDWNLVETRTNKPICFATILGGKYYLDEETRDGLTVRIATYGFKPGVANRIFKAQAFNIIRYYQNFLGPFPFKEFLIVEKNEWGYGQAPPGMMYITRDAFQQLMDVNTLDDLVGDLDRFKARGAKIPDRLTFKTMDVRHVFAHEIAHQYWGTVVKMPSSQEQWITESFADYCAALFEGDSKGKSLFVKNVASWRVQAEWATGKAPLPLANEIHEKDAFDQFYTRKGLLYAKGPTLLYSLHQELGDQVFLTWMKSIQTNFRWKFATTRQLFGLLGFITKKDYTPFYNDYYWGLALPPKQP
jgi:hypothetical protein